jgi:hypothetical protein
LPRHALVTGEIAAALALGDAARLGAATMGLRSAVYG